MTWLRPDDGLERQLRDQALIDVGVRRRIALEQILGVADDLDRRGRARERQRDVELDRHGAAHVDVPLERREALRADRNVIRVRRQVAEHEPAGRVGRRAAVESGDRVAELDGDRLHHAAGRVLHRALHGACAAEFLRPAAAGAEDGKRHYNHDLQELHETSLPNTVAIIRRRYQPAQTLATGTTRTAAPGSSPGSRLE